MYQIEIKHMMANLKNYRIKLGYQNAINPQYSKTQEFDQIYSSFIQKKCAFSEQLQNKQIVHNEAMQKIAQLKQLLKLLKYSYIRLQNKGRLSPQHLAQKNMILQKCAASLQQLHENLLSRSQGQKNRKKITKNPIKKPVLYFQNIDVEGNQSQCKFNDGEQKVDQEEVENQQHENNSDKQEIREIRQFQVVDAEQEVIMGDIIAGTQFIRKKVWQITRRQGQVQDKIEIDNKVIEQVQVKISDSNKKMKKVIEEMNPNRCCIASFLFFVLIGLVVAIVRFFISQNL